MKLIIILFFVIFPLYQGHGFVSQKKSLRHKGIAYFIPSLINPRYSGFEIGYISHKRFKKLKYSFNSFAKAFIAEEAFTFDPKLRAGSLGIKAGVMLPTQPWFPFFIEFSFGSAKTALHKDPWFGSRDKTVQKRSLFLLEIGAMLIHKKRYIYRINYQINNREYFSKHFFLSIGVNF